MKAKIDKTVVGIVILLGGFFVLYLFILLSPSSEIFAPEPSSDVFSDVFQDTCRNLDLDKDQLQELAELGGIDIKITNEYVLEFNSLPTCLNVCRQQYEHSLEDPDWFADSDVKEQCEFYDIILPVKK